MLSRIFRAAGATMVALAVLFAVPAHAANKTVAGITVDTNPTSIQRGVAYSFQITPSGPSGYAGSYSYSLISGALPSGVTLSASGLLSGLTCETNGPRDFGVRIATIETTPRTADFNGGNTFSVNVNGPPGGACALPITGTVPGGTVGTAYSGSVSASGGIGAPYTFSINSGVLPPGLTLSAAGAITGTPTTAGTYTFVVRGRDGDSPPSIGLASFSITIAAVPVTLVLNPATLPGGTTTVAYSQAVTASGGTGPYSYSVSAGALPGGLSLSLGGTLSGTPTTAGTYNFTLQATDALGNTGTRAYSVTIAGSATLTVNPATLPNATNHQAYAATITAANGTPAYTFAVTSGALPAGFTLASGGALSGTPSATGSHSFTVTATDANGNFGSRAYTLVIDPVTITVTPASLPGGTNGAAYNEAIGASGGTAPYTYSVTAGALPNGLSLVGGTLSGTPTAAGTFNFTIQAQDPNGDTGSRAYSVTIASATITVSPGSLPAATNGASYNEVLTASGGTGPYDFNITAGALPNGMTLSSTGTLSGTPNATAGTFNFTIEVTDANGDTVTQSFSITVTAATITVNPATLPGGTNGAAYSEAIGASGGTAPYSYSLTAGALPTGVSLAGGTIAGTPTAAGTFNFTIEAQDANGDTGSRAYSVTIGSATITVSPGTLPAATNGASYNQALTASGGTGPYDFNITAGALPSGMTLSSTGTLSGTPSATAGTFNFTIEVTDANGDTVTQSFSITVNAATITVNPATLPGGTNGAAYSEAIGASGGTAPYSYSLTSGALPTGVSLAGGTIAGTPTAAGTFNFTIEAQDANGDSGTRAYTVTISAATIAITPASLPGASNGVAYSQVLSASGGTAPYTFSIDAGALPSGFSATSGGTLSGTPTTAGTFNFTMKATDANGDSATQAYTLTVAAATIAITPSALPGGTNGTAYSQALTASGGTGPYSFALMSGALPVGMSFSSGGVLSGTPSSAGTYPLSIRATDANGDDVTQSYSLVIAAATIAITPSALPAGTNGTAYSQALTASGGTGPYSFALMSGALPVGMSFSSGGVLSGTPSSAGTYPLSIRATDANGDDVTQSYSLVIASATIAITPATLPGGNNGAAYSQALSATGGTAPYTYALASGTLPAGVTLSAAGMVSGTPSCAAASYGFTVEVTDGNGDTATQAYSVAISAASITIDPGALPGATNGTAYSQAFTANGGTGPYTFALASGALPTGLALSTTGTLSGTPHGAGTFDFTLEATDANGDIGTRSYTIATAGAALLSIDPDSLPGATAGDAYAMDIVATGGTGPYTYAITTGALPAGLVLAADGTLSGTPATAGNYTFTVTATGSDANFGTRSYTLAVAQAIVLDITPGTLSDGHAASPYAMTFGATGGTAPYTFTVDDGTLPPGLVLASDGTLSGTPTAAGTYTFAIRGEDDAGHAGVRSFTLIIGAALRADPTTVPTVTDGVREQVAAAGRAGEMQMRHVFDRLASPTDPCRTDDDNETKCKRVEAWATGTHEQDYGANGNSTLGAFTVGADAAFGKARLGVAFGTGWDVAERISGYRGDVDNTTWMLYGRVALGSVFGLEAVAGRSDLDLDSRRFLGGPEAVLGQREGDTTFAGLGVSGQWMFGEGGIGPYVRYERARTTLDGYAESANPLALQYGRLETRNSALVAGAEAFYGIRYGWGTLTPKVRVEYRDRSVRAANQAMWYLDTPGTQYVLGLPGMDDRTALATFGIEAAFRGLTLTLEYGSAGSATDWFDGQSLRFGLRAGF